MKKYYVILMLASLTFCAIIFSFNLVSDLEAGQKGCWECTGSAGSYWCTQDSTGYWRCMDGGGSGCILQNPGCGP